MLINCMVEQDRNPLVYAWSSSQFTVYELQESLIHHNVVPIEALLCPQLTNCTINNNGQNYSLEGTCFDLSKLHDWHFGTVYAIVKKVITSDQMFGSTRTEFMLVNVSHYMKDYDCDSILSGFCIYRQEYTVHNEVLSLVGFLIVVSNNRDIAHNILLTMTTEQDRAWSLHSAKRYEDSNLWQCLSDIESMCLPTIELRAPNDASGSFWIDSLNRHDGWTAIPIQYNQPYLMRFNFNKDLVTGNGFMDYYTIGCIGFGRLAVNDRCNYFDQIALQVPNTEQKGQQLEACGPRVVTQWLFKHEYHLTETFKGAETKIQYHRYY